MAVQVVVPSSVGFNSKIKYRYDVFLSFRGEDTRQSFTVILYEALRRKGINAFIDDKKLGKGERIAPALLKAIERSRISIIVFSKNYATSTWCLDELAHIIRCKNEKNQMVMPIFYKVNLEDVQYQRNSFEEAMAAHEEKFRKEAEEVRNILGEGSAAHEDKLRENLENLKTWKSALSEAAGLSPAWIFEDGYDESGFIKSIVEDACTRLPQKRFHNGDNIVGLEPCIEEVMSLLDETDNRVCMLGIHGTGGIGKTTLAKAIYQRISYQFQGSCFLFDVKNASRKYQGVVRLQQTLLSEILDEKIMIFGSVGEGISRIKHRLFQKRVLLVLDDVDEVEHLEQLAGGCDWFGYGSKVIITTRNKHLLIACNVEKAYEMRKLNEHDSLELFCWHAFHRKQPPENYRDMSSCAMSYAQGLPLALRTIGSNLANKNLEEWRSIIEQYKRIPERTIHEILKISYDCLQDGAKSIFLDLACFANDDEILKSIDDIVEACDYRARFYFEVLVDKSLLTFIDKYSLSMHDLIRQMGKEIVRQEAPFNPEKRSRLWHYKDVLKVLRENLGCNNIEGILLDPPQKETVKWSGNAFENMNNLRILVVRNVQFSTGPVYLSNKLRWLEWEGYPSTTLPTNFSPVGLIVLKLTGSFFRLSEPFMSFTKYVTEMNFSFCKHITEVPNMSQCQSLRNLELRHCRKLIKVDDSVGSLSKLKNLDLAGCWKLSGFPREIKMPSLRVLGLAQCRRLEYFPHVVGNMDALKEIYITRTAIRELPSSFANLSGLQELFMHSCKRLRELPTFLFTLPRLLDLGGTNPRTRKSLITSIQPNVNYPVGLMYLRNCGLLDEELHHLLNHFRNLRRVYVSGNEFVSLPKCIKECAHLEILEMRECKRLRDIPELPSNLLRIAADNCISLTPESLDILYSQAKKELNEFCITIPAITPFPDWFDYCCDGSTLSFHARGSLPRAVLALEVVGKPSTTRLHNFLVLISINGHIIVKPDFKKNLPFGVRQGHRMLFDGFLHFTEEMEKGISRYMELDWNEVEIQIISESPDDVPIVDDVSIGKCESPDDVPIVKCGFYVHKKESNMENVRFKSSLKRRRAIIASPSNHEPPNKFIRTDKRKLSNTKKGSRTIIGHQTYHSCYSRKMVFPVGKLVWKFVYN